MKKLFVGALAAYMSTAAYFACAAPDANWIIIGEDATTRASVDAANIRVKNDLREVSVKYEPIKKGKEDDSIIALAYYSCKDNWRSIFYTKEKVFGGGRVSHANLESQTFLPGSLEYKIMLYVCDK